MTTCVPLFAFFVLGSEVGLKQILLVLPTHPDAIVNHLDFDLHFDLAELRR